MTDITRGISPNVIARLCWRYNTPTLNMATGTLFGRSLEYALGVASFTLYIFMRII